MIRAVISFQVKPGCEEAFEAAFNDAGMFTRPAQLDGFVSMELMRSDDDPTGYLVVSNWKSHEVYKKWQSISSREAPREALVRLGETLIDPQPGKTYAIVPPQ